MPAVMLVELNGDDTKLGLIKSLEAELQQPLQAKSNLTRQQLNDLGAK